MTGKKGRAVINPMAPPAPPVLDGEVDANGVPRIPTIDADFHHPGNMFGNAIESGNPGTRILTIEETYIRPNLKMGHFENTDEGNNAAAALAWCLRFNRTGKMQHHIEATMMRIEGNWGVHGKGVKLYAETANGLQTTDTNGKAFAMPWSRDKENQRVDSGNKLSHTRP